MERVRKGFTLIELLVVMAIIAILAAIAIPQYNKYRSNAMLSNVQQLTKSIAKQAVDLATVAGQNPNGSGLSEFYVKYVAGTDNGSLIAYSNSSCSNDTELDKVTLFSKKPKWVENVEVKDDTNDYLTLTIGGTGVDFNDGYVGVASTYKIGTNEFLGCKYYPDNDTLTNYDGTHFCNTMGK